MITPFTYRLGIELASHTVRAVLAETARESCRLVGAVECDHTETSENSKESAADLLSSMARILPNTGEITLASLVLPCDGVIESSAWIPKGLRMEREDWERWELSTRLPDPPGDYWYESSYAKESICGRFGIRRVFAVRKRLIGSILKAAARTNLFIDRLLFPQSIWGNIVLSFGLGADSARLECVYLGRRLSYFFRVSGGAISEISPVQLPADHDAQRFMETVVTLLSWHGDGPATDARRVVIDGGGPDEVVRAMTSRFGFTRFDSRSLSKRLHGVIDEPERFLLPLAALGVI